MAWRMNMYNDGGMLSTSMTKYANHISENGRYFMEGDRPFFWLGDTAWLMFQKLNAEEIGLYLRNRREKGYNVIQTVLVHTLPGVAESGCSLAPGLKNVTEGAYWEFVDEILDMAEGMGLYLGLLPAWGSMVKNSWAYLWQQCGHAVLFCR